MHCLLQHPDYTINESQRRRLILQIMTKNEEYPGYQDRIRFSYYRDLASVRGRLVDDRLLCLGWYSYDRREGIDGRQIWGHTNPVISLEPTSTEGQVLTQFFSTVFNNLLEQSNSWEELASQYELVIRHRQGTERNELVRFDLDIARHDVGDSVVPVNISMRSVAASQLGEVSSTGVLALLSGAFEDRPWDEDVIARSVLSTTCRAVVTAHHGPDDRLVGFVSLHSTDAPEVGKVHWLAVADEWRGQGIGRALVTQVWQIARQSGFSRLMLHTERYRTAAITLYRALGFEETPELVH